MAVQDDGFFRCHPHAGGDLGRRIFNSRLLALPEITACAVMTYWITVSTGMTID